MNIINVQQSGNVVTVEMSKQRATELYNAINTLLSVTSHVDDETCRRLATMLSVVMCETTDEGIKAFNIVSEFAVELGYVAALDLDDEEVNGKRES
jgi:uncharacterized membrane protein